MKFKNYARSDFSDVEIEMFFGKNDGDGDGTLNIMEQHPDELENERPQTGREAKSGKIG